MYLLTPKSSLASSTEAPTAVKAEAKKFSQFSSSSMEPKVHFRSFIYILTLAS